MLAGLSPWLLPSPGGMANYVQQATGFIHSPGARPPLRYATDAFDHNPSSLKVMLKNIAPCISPDLLKTLAEMGHGDGIVLSDAHFPGHTFGTRHVLRADGIPVTTLLDGILPLFELDSYAPPLVMMEPVPGDALDPQVEAAYMETIRRHAPAVPAPVRLERFAFYERAKTAFAVLVTGETRKYGNIILKKGVTPSP
jgi:L-fucose mutarotase